MSHFMYSFCLSLFHSLWQAALLFAFYSSIGLFIKKQLPLFKRNLLYLLVFLQMGISCITFYLYYYNHMRLPDNHLLTNFAYLLPDKTLFEIAAPWITAIYSAMVIVKSFQLIINWRRFKQLRKSSFIKPPLDLRLFMLKKANEFGISRKITLWLSDVVSTPLTFGFFKPVILMPVALLNQLTVEDAESLIIHELAHIKNNDYLLNWMLVVTEILFFFNPFVRILSAKIKLEREKNCDVQVLHFKYSSVQYAETLLKTARFKSNINSLSLAAVFKNKQLLQRIHFFSSQRNLAFTSAKSRFVPAIMLASLLFINLVILENLKENNIEGAGAFALYQPRAIISPVALSELQRNDVPSAGNENFGTTQKRNADIKTIPGKTHFQQQTNLTQGAAKNSPQPSISKAEENYLIPVSNIGVTEKEILIEEENFVTGETLTTAYQVKFEKGVWKKELLYVLKEGRSNPDSAASECKDSVIKALPVPMQ